MKPTGAGAARLHRLTCDGGLPVRMSGNPGAALDDATLTYVDAMRAPFDLLRQAAAQVAGVLVLAVSGNHGTAGHPMLDLAASAQLEASDALRRAPPPRRARHHHLHLLHAGTNIGLALEAARLHLRGSDEAGTDAVLRPLRAGFQELQRAAAALPGLEIVAFSQGCCAQHPARQRRDLIQTTT